MQRPALRPLAAPAFSPRVASQGLRCGIPAAGRASGRLRAPPARAAAVGRFLGLDYETPEMALQYESVIVAELTNVVRGVRLLPTRSSVC